MELEWKSIALKKGLERHLPAKAGIYVVKEVQRIMNLPVSQKFIYVGKSLNLERRYKDHCSIGSEHNPGLLTERLNKDLEFWYALANKDQITKLEKELIKAIKPTANIVMYKEKGKK